MCFFVPVNGFSYEITCIHMSALTFKLHNLLKFQLFTVGYGELLNTFYDKICLVEKVLYNYF